MRKHLGRETFPRQILNALQTDQLTLSLQVSDSTLNRYKTVPLAHGIKALRRAFSGLDRQEQAGLEGGPKGAKFSRQRSWGGVLGKENYRF